MQVGRWPGVSFHSQPSSAQTAIKLPSSIRKDSQQTRVDVRFSRHLMQSNGRGQTGRWPCSPSASCGILICCCHAPLVLHWRPGWAPRPPRRHHPDSPSPHARQKQIASGQILSLRASAARINYRGLHANNKNYTGLSRIQRSSHYNVFAMENVWCGQGIQGCPRNLYRKNKNPRDCHLSKFI